LLSASRQLFRAKFRTCRRASAGNQLDTEFWEVLCDESGNGGDGGFCCDNDAQLDSPERNTPKRAPPNVLPGTLPAPTVLALHFSSTILRLVSRSATEKENFYYFFNYL
jgi:hypothetical protein